jgi:dihydroneopterin aldolase
MEPSTFSKGKGEATNPAQKLDVIRISGFRCYGYTGYFPEENKLGQWFELDLSIWLDLSITGANDQLEHSLNYADVVERLKTLIETSRFKTIERLNSVITEAVLAFPPVYKVHSRLVKLSPPIPGFGGQIAIEMTRSKGELS